jgi:hypothetical protein
MINLSTTGLRFDLLIIIRVNNFFFFSNLLGGQKGVPQKSIPLSTFLSEKINPMVLTKLKNKKSVKLD